MGFFSGKKKTYVSSVVYNLAGDEAERPNYLKTTMLGAVISGAPSVGIALVNSYLSGPGLRLRSYGRWARTQGYTATIGQQSGNIIAGNSISYSGIASQIPADPGKTVSVQSAKIGRSDYAYWVDQYMLANHPDLVSSQFEADFDEGTNRVTLSFGESFIATGYLPGANYIYATYQFTSGSSLGPIIIGTEEVVTTFPPTAGWTNESSTSVPKTVQLAITVLTTVSYSDGRPDEVTTTTDEEEQAYNETTAVWKRTDYLGISGSGVKSLHRTRTFTAVGLVEPEEETTVTTEVIGTVTKTTTVKTTIDIFSLVRKVREDTQEETSSEWTPLQVMIYRQGSGNPVLDAMFNPSEGIGQFLPYIPIRIDNKFIGDDWHPNLIVPTRSAYRKATNGSINKTTRQVADNDSIGDIDYVYTVFGVSLNVKENACRKYVYKFLQAIMEDPNLNRLAEYNEWKIKWAEADDAMSAWYLWYQSQMQQDPEFPPLVPVPEPIRIPYPDVPGNSIQVSSAGYSAMNYDMTISWHYVEESFGSGLAKPSAKEDDLWFNKLETTEFIERYYSINEEGLGIVSFHNVIEIERIELVWQETRTSWRKIVLAGFKHRNMIYGGKAVEITAKEALDDTEESGFIIPLHETIYRSMGMVDMTQMSTACCFLVFNCYKVVKQKWYQTGLFQIIVIIVVIFISLYDGGATASGVLGSSSAVGTTLGFTGTTALVVGAAVNAIAGMILMTIIQQAAIGLFGDKFGALIGAVLSVVALQVATSMANGATMSASFGQLMKADNILKLTGAVGKGYAGYAQAAMAETMQATQELVENYSIENKEISEKYYELVGDGTASPEIITNAIQSLNYEVESASSFLGRTLMTGTEIAELSLQMITEFVSLTTSLELK